MVDQDGASTVGNIRDSLGLIIVVGGLAKASGLVDIGPDMLQLLRSPPLWTVLAGCIAILMVTWRLWGAPLAVAGLAALLYAATWRHGIGMPGIEALDLMRTIENTDLWRGQDPGRLGWVLDTTLSKAFPLFVVGYILAGRLFSEAVTDLPAIDAAGKSGLVDAFHAACRFFLPPLALGMIFMAERPGVELPFIAAAAILPFSLAVAWFWIRPGRKEGIMLPGRSGWPKIALVTAAAAVFITAIARGMSLQGAALVTLGAVMVLSIIDTDVRRRPWLVLRVLARSGADFGRLLIAAGVIGIILAVLARSGLPLDIAQILAAVTGEAGLPLLLLTVIVALGQGMVMPGLAAYLITAALLGPSLRTVGVADLTSHMTILLVCAGASAMVAARAVPVRSRVARSTPRDGGMIRHGAPVEGPRQA